MREMIIIQLTTGVYLLEEARGDLDARAVDSLGRDVTVGAPLAELGRIRCPDFAELVDLVGVAVVDERVEQSAAGVGRCEREVEGVGHACSKASTRCL
jgi:hypothetical protein